MKSPEEPIPSVEEITEHVLNQPGYSDYTPFDRWYFRFKVGEVALEDAINESGREQ